MHQKKREVEKCARIVYSVGILWPRPQPTRYVSLASQTIHHDPRLLLASNQFTITCINIMNSISVFMLLFVFYSLRANAQRIRWQWNFVEHSISAPSTNAAAGRRKSTGIFGKKSQNFDFYFPMHFLQLSQMAWIHWKCSTAHDEIRFFLILAICSRNLFFFFIHSILLIHFFIRKERIDVHCFSCPFTEIFVRFWPRSTFSRRNASTISSSVVITSRRNRKKSLAFAMLQS